MDGPLVEHALEEAIQREVSEGEFKDAHTHRLKRRFSEYYEAQKRKWSELKGFSLGYNPIEKFKDIPSIFTISLYPDYVIVGPVEKEGIKHQYTDVINTLLGYINRNLIHPYLLDLLDRGEYLFYDNYIVVEVADYRESEPTTKRVLLKGIFAGILYTPTLLVTTKADDLEESQVISKTTTICLDPEPNVFEVLKVQDYNEKKLDQIKIDMPQARKIHIGGIIKEYRRMQSIQKKEVAPGLERIGNSRIYRTAKFIGGTTHYSINAIANADYIEVVFRQGEVVNTAIGGFITKRKFTSAAQIDLYIDSTKKLLEIYHSNLKCICDISATPRKPTKTYPAYQRVLDERRSSPGSLSNRTSPVDNLKYAQRLDSEFEDKRWKDPKKEELDEFNFDYVNKKFI